LIESRVKIDKKDCPWFELRRQQEFQKFWASLFKRYLSCAAVHTPVLTTDPHARRQNILSVIAYKDSDRACTPRQHQPLAVPRQQQCSRENQHQSGQNRHVSIDNRQNPGETVRMTNVPGRRTTSVPSNERADQLAREGAQNCHKFAKNTGWRWPGGGKSGSTPDSRTGYLYKLGSIGWALDVFLRPDRPMATLQIIMSGLAICDTELTCQYR
jgi:hypothetical protein